MKNEVLLRFDPPAMERLDALCAKTEAATYAEVVRNALRLYEALIDEHERGERFFTRSPDGKITVMRIFE